MPDGIRYQTEIDPIRITGQKAGDNGFSSVGVAQEVRGA